MLKIMLIFLILAHCGLLGWDSEDNHIWCSGQRKVAGMCYCLLCYFGIDNNITPPPLLTPPLPPQTQREKLLARESLFEKELKLATEKNINEDTSDSLLYSQSGSGQRWADFNEWYKWVSWGSGCEISGQLSSQEISTKNPHTRPDVNLIGLSSHSSVLSFVVHQFHIWI